MDKMSVIVNGEVLRETAREFLERTRKEKSPQEKRYTNEDSRTTAKLRELVKQSKQEVRDRIVEQAKADIAELKVKEYPYDGEYYRVSTGGEDLVCRAEFVVNKDKRTVVALMRGYSSGIVRAKGIAKCAPDDCFNVHIGKAIALRRALRLDVPDEYIYAPQPTEARVGDVVEFPSGLKAEVLDNSECFGRVKTLSDGEKCSVESFNLVTVIDDTREV